jgi:hypothetical protein
MDEQITLVTSQEMFDDVFLSLVWHDAFVKESNFVAGMWRSANGVSCADGDVLRLLFVLPYQSPNSAMEIVAFDVKHYKLGSFLDDNLPVGEIRRRDAHLSVGSFVSIHASCLGYRWIDNRFAGLEEYYAARPIHNESGELVPPFSLDWRTEMDLALQSNKDCKS